MGLTRLAIHRPLTVLMGILALVTIRSRDGSAAPHDEWIVQEHSPAHWERSLNLPHEVDDSAISAEYQDGILELCLPKAEPRGERRIPVKSGGE